MTPDTTRTRTSPARELTRRRFLQGLSGAAVGAGLVGASRRAPPRSAGDADRRHAQRLPHLRSPQPGLRQLHPPAEPLRHADPLRPEPQTPARPRRALDHRPRRDVGDPHPPQGRPLPQRQGDWSPPTWSRTSRRRPTRTAARTCCRPSPTSPRSPPRRRHRADQVQEGVAGDHRSPPGHGHHRAGRHGLASRTGAAGTGPFKFVEWVPGRPHDARAQPRLLGDGERPGSTGWSSRSSATPTPWWPRSSPASATWWSRCPRRTPRAWPASSTWSAGTPGALTYEIRVNGTRPPFDKKEARQALPLRHRPPGRGQQRALRRERADRAPVQQGLPGLRSVAGREVPLRPQAGQGAASTRPASRGGRAECLTLPQFPELPGHRPGPQGRPGQDRLHARHRVVDSTLYYKRVLGGDFQVAPSFSGNTQKYPTRVSLNSIYRTANNPVWKRQRAPGLRGRHRGRQQHDGPGQAEGGLRPDQPALLDESWVVSIAYRQSVWGLAKHVDGFAFTVDDMAVLENVPGEVGGSLALRA